MRKAEKIDESQVNKLLHKANSLSEANKINMKSAAALIASRKVKKEKADAKAPAAAPTQ